MKANEDRNRELVEKRKIDKKKWTWGKLGEHFHIHRSTAKEIFLRDKKKYSVGMSTGTR